MNLFIAFAFAVTFLIMPTALINPIPGAQMIVKAKICDLNQCKCLDDTDCHLVK